MYKRFYQLQRNPFEITPDPAFLYATRMHNEALAALVYGVHRRKGFVVLTGEVGTGKTLLVRCLLRFLNRAKIATAYVFNPRLNPQEFLQYITGDLGLPTTGKSKSELLLDLSKYVIARYQQNLTTVLIVDEAHHLSGEVLEEVRLLTNLESAGGKLLQIALVGQPELDATLDSNDLRQLKQRIALRAQLRPLEFDETRGYVYRRLELAGSSSPATIFPTDTIAEVHQQSKGFPRLINTLCENALIHGYVAQSSSINTDTIREVSASFRLNVIHQPQGQQKANGSGSEDARVAAQHLLELYAHLLHFREDESMRVTQQTGVKHEPYI